MAHPQPDGRQGFIDRAAAEAALSGAAQFRRPRGQPRAPHFAVYVRQQLEELYGAEMVANGGLRVTTTLNMDFQQLAEGPGPATSRWS